jgi:hypothetical protein
MDPRNYVKWNAIVGGVIGILGVALGVVRGQFPVRGFGHQMSAPLAVMFNSR